MASKQEQAVSKAIKAVNRPALYRKIAKAAIEIDSVRGEEMGEFVIGLCNDEKMRELMTRFAKPRFCPIGVTKEEKLEDTFSELSQLVATIIAATRESRAA